MRLLGSELAVNLGDTHRRNDSDVNILAAILKSSAEVLVIIVLRETEVFTSSTLGIHQSNDSTISVDVTVIDVGEEKFRTVDKGGSNVGRSRGNILITLVGENVVAVKVGLGVTVLASLGSGDFFDL